MKVDYSIPRHVSALLAAHLLFVGDAFTMPSTTTRSSTSLSSTFLPDQQQQQQLQQRREQAQQQQLQYEQQQQQPPQQGGSLSMPSEYEGFLKGDEGNTLAPEESIVRFASPDDMEMFPIYPELELIQGGGTVKTYKMPPWAERCQMLFRTTGRPIKAKAELWLGPRRTTHQLHMNVEDGNETPIQATLKFKKAAQVLKITTTGSVEFPVLVGVYVPPPGRAEELRINTERIWNTCGPEYKQVIQGGIVQDDGQPGPGAYRYWNIPANVKSVQILAWSIDTGKKSFKADIEVLQGPNSNKQRYFLQCGGGSQPYHGVFQTPGDASIIGIRNKKYLEDGLTQFAVVPYEVYD